MDLTPPPTPASAPLPPGAAPFGPEELIAALDALDRKDSGRTASLGILAITVFLFFGSGLLNQGVVELLLLMGVLLFHELGHFLGMRAFRYQNVQMFFLPFFGAAVSGNPRNAAGWKQGVVTLLGPVPGLFAGYAVGIVHLVAPSPILGQLAFLLVAVNGCNLIPFHPLDGGRLLGQVLFNRSRWTEAVFRVIAGIGLIALGGGSPILTGLGVLVLLLTSYNFKVSTLAIELRARGAAPEPASPAVPQLADARDLIDGIGRVFSGKLSARTITSIAQQVWRKACTHPPGGLATAGLLGAYGLSILSLAVAAFAFLGITGAKFERELHAATDAFAAQRPAEAEAHYRTAVQLARDYSMTHSHLVEALVGEAQVLAAAGKPADAEAAYDEAIRACETQPNSRIAAFPRALEGKAGLLRARGKEAEAAALEERARAMR